MREERPAASEELTLTDSAECLIANRKLTEMDKVHYKINLKYLVIAKSSLGPKICPTLIFNQVVRSFKKKLEEKKNKILR